MLNMDQKRMELKQQKKSTKENSTSKEFAIEMDHHKSVPKQDQECLLLPKSTPNHLMMRKPASQPYYMYPDAVYFFKYSDKEENTSIC